MGLVAINIRGAGGASRLAAGLAYAGVGVEASVAADAGVVVHLVAVEAVGEGGAAEALGIPEEVSILACVASAGGITGRADGAGEAVRGERVVVIALGADKIRVVLDAVVNSGAAARSLIVNQVAALAGGAVGRRTACGTLGAAGVTNIVRKVLVVPATQTDVGVSIADQASVETLDASREAPRLEETTHTPSLIAAAGSCGGALEAVGSTGLAGAALRVEARLAAFRKGRLPAPAGDGIGIGAARTNTRLEVAAWRTGATDAVRSGGVGGVRAGEAG